MRSRIFFVAVLFGNALSFSTLTADEPSQHEDEVLNAPLFGRITDENGEPVTDAHLTLRGPQYLKAKTDDQGRYAFLDLAKPGNYRLRVESQGWVGFTEYREQVELILDPDRHTEKDLTLQRACQLKIKVVDENNTPVIAKLYSHSVDHSRSSKTITARTNQQGNATIGGIPRSKAKQIVTAHANGFAFVRTHADVTDPDVTGEHTIVMKRGLTVRGKAVCTDGNPPTGWHIYSQPTWYKFGPGKKGAEIAKDGSFELPDIGDDAQDVYIKIPLGDGNSTAKLVRSDAVLTKLEQPINVKLDYPSPASMKFLTCTIRWIGKPAERGFGLDGYCQDLEHHTDHFIKSDAKEVKLGPMPAGIYRFRPDSGQIELMNLRGIKNLDKLDQVKVPSDDPIQIVVRVKGKPHLQGTVIDAATKRPIPSFHMRVSKVKTLSGRNFVTGDEWHVVNNDNGQFFYDVGPGVYYTRILADGYAMKQSIEVNTDETPDKMVEIALDKGVAVSGRVVDGDGNGVAEASVRAVSLAGGSYGDDIREFVTDMRAVRTNKNGEFTFEHLSQGYDKFRVDHDQYVFKVTSVSVKEDMKPVNIVLKQGATIQGTVFDQHGEPAANEPIFVHEDNNFGGGRDQEPGLFGKTITDENGRFTVTHVPERLVFLCRDNPWRAHGVTRRAVRTREAQTHTINLGGKAKITGELRIDDQPLADSRIKLTGDDSTSGEMVMYGKTETDGSFTLRGAPPGHWVLYRTVIGSRSDWAKVSRVDVPVAGDVTLGTLNAPTGTLTVKFNSDLPPPANLRVDLQQHNDLHDIGRTAARLIARKETTDPLVFQGVVPGDYDLDVNFGEFEIRKRLKITPSDLDANVELEIPSGKATARVTVLDKNDKPSRATMQLWSADGSVNTRMQTGNDEDGNPYHEATGLADGKYVIRSYFQRNGLAGELEIVDGKDVTNVIKLPEYLSSPDVNLEFTVYDEQGAFVRAEVEVVSEKTMDVRQGDFMDRTKLIVPIGSTFTAKINVLGYEPFEQEFQNIQKRQSIKVLLKRTQ